jgi:type IV pilus biogenesis protein CpaD/CtpE
MDPYTRSGMWQPIGVNARNLAAMMANPSDMVRGHGETDADSRLATEAVTRLMAGKVKPLPSTSSQSNGTAPAGGGASGGS